MGKRASEPRGLLAIRRDTDYAVRALFGLAASKDGRASGKELAKACGWAEACPVRPQRDNVLQEIARLLSRTTLQDMLANAGLRPGMNQEWARCGHVGTRSN